MLYSPQAHALTWWLGLNTWTPRHTELRCDPTQRGSVYQPRFHDAMQQPESEISLTGTTRITALNPARHRVAWGKAVRGLVSGFREMTARLVVFAPRGGFVEMGHVGRRAGGCRCARRYGVANRVVDECGSCSSGGWDYFWDVGGGLVALRCQGWELWFGGEKGKGFVHSMYTCLVQWVDFEAGGCEVPEYLQTIECCFEVHMGAYGCTL